MDGRKDKNGNIPNEKTKLVVEKLNELREKEKSGEFVSHGSHDILTEALGNPDHGGHVRGVGGKATLTSVFKRKRRCNQTEGMLTIKQVEEIANFLTEQVREQTRAEMRVVTLDILKSCGIQVPKDLEVNMNVPTRSSCQSIDPDPFANGSKKPIPCDILVLEESFGNRVVATGTLLKSVPGELVHGVPLLEDHVKVKILYVVEGEENTPLPLPFFGHESLGEIKGSWAQWPRSQVRLSIENLIDQPPPPKKIRNNLMEGKKLVDAGSAVESRFNDNEEELAPFLIGKDMFLALPNSFKQLYNLYKNRDVDFSVDVDFEEDILYYPDKVSFTAYVFGDDLKKLLNMEYIRTSCVDIWIRFLQNEITKNKLQEEVGFFCPHKLGLVKLRPSIHTKYVNHSITKQSTKKYILAPIRQDKYHWMLVVICLERGEAFFFDSMADGSLENLHTKGSLSVAYRTLMNMDKGSRKMKLTWKVVKCPRSQQVGLVESGYYVMKYMDQTVSLVLKKERDFQKHFTLEAYTQEIIDDVRERWCRFFIDNCL
ncbi:uncharacterized protein [Spinacia oleracea]|uniref:Ubiquitin-like protease family profile domain-containing protein n=1 Tax=Spinacia oleracea TaxID=3562 RepID=A0A9R0IFG1_SPIOL|nr:uncharacterized protein LOC110787849 [Spinacia oleracea]XP_056690981.1 uncharacterized protein LOC110787849 [Spinacia oleracea]XP_056690982.1 uncharacterized protein LOC110787849 [Spinacia oleracea]XP_056690983.1 uncharacterized protein LOC110787849 [Spinacia oleracea]XP_056690984.1 uncharacterized protein LOC110787849 [Spinacia oleracea]